MVLYLLFGVACLIIGIIVGVWLEMVYASAAMSRSQQHMQKKVRQAQDAAEHHQTLIVPPAFYSQERW